MTRVLETEILRPNRPRRHDRLKPIYLFETTVRTWLVTTPRVLAKRFPAFNRTTSLLFMYMMFQVLALLGAFLLNAICSVTLDITGLATRHAFDFSITLSIVHGFATFYVTYSTIRVFVRFGQAVGVIAWESLDDFPDARKIVANATASWPMFISVVFIPQCLIALSLVGTPWLCAGVPAPDPSIGGFKLMAGDALAAGINQAFPFNVGWESMLGALREDGLVDKLRGLVCTRTPLLYFTRPYPSPRRTMTAVLIVGLVQYTQILLHRFPSWQADMRASGKAGRLCVHFSLLGCLTLTARWLAGWVAMQLGLDLRWHGWLADWVKARVRLVDLATVWSLAFGDMDVQESGMWLVMAWTLWLAVVAYVLCKNSSAAGPKDAELRTFFQNLKTSFIVAVTFFFLRGCLSPTMGFIEAQQELTILTIVIPILYVALYTTVNAALQLSVGLVVLGGPAAMVMSVQLCRSSGLGGPGTVVIVFVHIFIKLLHLFGDDAFTNPDTDGYDDGDARGLSSSAPGLPPPPPPSSVPPSLTVDDASDGSVSATTKKKKESPVGAEKGSSGGGGVTEGQLGEQGTQDQKTKDMETLVRGRGGVKDRGDGEDGLFEPSLQSPPSSALPMELPRSRKRSHDHSRAWSTSPPPAHLARCHRLQQQQQQQQSNASLALRLLGADAEQPGEKGDVGGGVRGRGVAGIGVKNDPASPVRMSSREAVFRGVAAQPNGRRVEDRYDGHGDGARARLMRDFDCRQGLAGVNFCRFRLYDGDGRARRRRIWSHVVARLEGGRRSVKTVPYFSCKTRLCLYTDNTQVHQAEIPQPRRHLVGRRGTSVRNVEVVKEALASRQGQQRCPRQRSANERHDDEDDDHRGSGVTTQAGEGRGEKNHRPRSNRWMGMGMSMGMGSVDPGALASGLAAAMETTNAQFVFKGTIRGATAFLAIVSLFLASCQIISLLQEEHAWYPSLIKYSVTDSKQLVVDNAFVVKATLETSGDPVTVAPRYASCGMKWNGLSLLDYALLAELAYFDQHNPAVPLSEVAEQFFPGGKNGPDFQIKVQEGDHHSHAQFFEAYSPTLNVSVVSIRGTDVGRISDLIEDMKIWVEPMVFEVLSMVFPTIRIWPDSTSSAVIEYLHETLQLFGLHQQAHYYRPLLEYVRSIKDRDVVLTGHSLGGGLARIVGALEKATSICFSPPGIAQSYRKFSVGAESLDRALLHQMSVSVIPEHDFVPMIDTQVGLIQLISCSTSGQALQMSCHMLEGTICDIVRHCGDERGRFTDCKFEHNMAHLLPQVLKLAQGKMIWIMGLAALILLIATLVILPDFLV
ncbi:unnamed protein product [Ascophyllum nodosum]